MMRDVDGFGSPPRTGPVLVTRHPALAQYLIEEGMVPSNIERVEHATPADVKGREVYGVLPLRLAALASRIVEISLDIPAELRGVELTIEQIRSMGIGFAAYRVSRDTDFEGEMLGE